jgi:hypothetical protein
MPDPWSVLGVPPGTALDEVRHAYLARLQLLHPDRHQGAGPSVVAEAERATRELNAAWKAVSSGAPFPALVQASAPPTSPGACLQWAIDRLLAAGVAEGRPLTADEIDLLRRPRAAAPRGRRFERWLEGRRRTLRGAVAADGVDAWSSVVRVLADDAPPVVLSMLFAPAPR